MSCLSILYGIGCISILCPTLLPFLFFTGNHYFIFCICKSVAVTVYSILYDFFEARLFFLAQFLCYLVFLFLVRIPQRFLFNFVYLFKTSVNDLFSDLLLSIIETKGFPVGASGKQCACQAEDVFNPGLKIP